MFFWFCLFPLALPVVWGLLGSVIGWFVGLVCGVHRRVASSGASGGVGGGLIASVGFMCYWLSLPYHIVRQEWGPARVLDHPPPSYLVWAWMFGGAAAGGLLLAIAAARGRR
jgi:hypothetical protein